MSRHARSLPLSQPGVVCTVEDYGDRMFVFYWGTPQDLVAAGCVSQETLYPGRRKGVKKRRDEHGDVVYLDRSANGRWRVMRIKPRATAVHLPGVEMYLKCRPDVVATEFEIPPSHPRPSSRPSYLRLVVDNTRGVGHG